MQTLLAQLQQRFRAAIRIACNIDADPLLTPAQNEKFGDYQSNAAMGLAKQLGQKPRDVAQKIVDALEIKDLATEITIAGPGFINVKLSPAWLASLLRQAGAGQAIAPAPAERQTVVVDYSGPNIAKQMHVGHLRSTIIGDTIARVIEALGHTVIRQNHVGDWGTQFGMLISHLRTAGLQQVPYGLEAGGPTSINDLEDFYRQAKKRFDDDLNFQNQARATVVRLQSGEQAELEAWRQIVDETRLHYQPIYARLNVKLTQSDERGESFYNPFLAGIVQNLRDKGLAVESQGAVAVFIDGPDKNPVIVEKTGGGFLYATTDLAALRYRAQELRADRIIYTHDSRQAQHFDQVFRIARQAGFVGHSVQLDYAPFGTMLGADGKPFKTRSGDTVKLKDLLDEAHERAMAVVEQKNPNLPADQKTDIARAVGIGAVKYADLSKDRISDYVFDWDKMLSLDGNTAPYLQYAYARIKSIFRKADASAAAGGGVKDEGAEIRLNSPFELSLAKHILQFGEAVESVARELKPHVLCTSLYELASKFSGFYENCPVLTSEEPLRSSRLSLCDLAARTMATGLDLLGIEHPEQM